MTETTYVLPRSSGRESKVRVKPGRVVSVGGEGDKSFVSTKVVGPSGKERHSGQFFVKYDLSNDSGSSSRPEYVLEKYKWLKERGFPVVPTLRFDKESRTLFMTDMTEGGQKLLVDWHYPLEHFGLATSQISNWDEIKQEVKDIAVRAHSEGMALNEDNYAVVLERRDGGYYGHVFLIDLGFGAYFLAERDKKIEKQLEGVGAFFGYISRY